VAREAATISLIVTPIVFERAFSNLKSISLAV